MLGSGGASPGETSPPTGEAALKIPLPRAQSELQERITAGRELAQTKVTSIDGTPGPGSGSPPLPANPALPDLNALHHYVRDWRKVNQAWLNTNLGSEAAQEYEEAALRCEAVASRQPTTGHHASYLCLLRRHITREIATLQIDPQPPPALEHRRERRKPRHQASPGNPRSQRPGLVRPPPTPAR